jgi:hypothetical protein
VVCLIAAAVGASGCAAGTNSESGEDGGADGDGRPRPRGDAGGEPDAAIDSGPGEDSGGGLDTSGGSDSGGTCTSGVTCGRTAECASAGLTNYVCGDDGCCQPEQLTPVVECARHLASCDDEDESNDNFICDVEAGMCVQRCNVAATEDELGANCPVNSYCFDAGLTDPPVSGEGDVLDGACVPGDCDSDIFDAAACPDGTCLPVANGASFCIAAGTAEPGDICGQSDADEPPVSDVCAAGLLCFRGRCVTPCDLDGAGACTGGETCVEVFDTTPENQPGLCGSACDPFSTGDCAGGEACSPAWGRLGVTQWLCAPIPGTPVAPGAVCDIDDYGNFANCPEGYICLPESAGGTARCTQICDPTSSAAGTLADCAGPAGDLVCPASGINGIGFCQDACEPYPRRADYGCAADETCAPFIGRDDVPVEPQGYCTGDEGGAAVGAACANEGYLGNGNCPASDAGCGCADLNVCLGDDSGRAECASLCEPFSSVSDQCGSSTCSSVPPLLGSLNLSFCIEGAQAGDAFDECFDPGTPCAADGTICIEFTDGSAACLPICREGFTDCAEFAGTTCEAGAFNDPVPAFMGVCN